MLIFHLLFQSLSILKEQYCINDEHELYYNLIMYSLSALIVFCISSGMFKMS